jgi:uncharacterized protein (DUF302 family)
MNRLGGEMAEAIEGLAQVRSAHSVDEAVAKITTMLAAKGVTVFAVVDHSGEAAKVGLAMRPTRLVIFGSPKAGTPLMIAAPTLAIDLPLKLLVWEDEHGGVWIGYNTVDYLRERHHFPEELSANLAVEEVLARRASE